MLNFVLAIWHECYTIYDGFMYYWFVHANIEPSLIVEWFEVELLRDLRFLWLVLYEEGAWVMICHNCVDCEVMCSSLGRFCQVVL